jgi:ERCC4-type nuclease
MRSGVPAILAAAGVPISAAQLAAGEYVLSDRLIVERETGADLAASIKSRRVFEQVTRHVEGYPSVVLLVEGDPVHISESSWRRAVGRALGAGVAVMRTADPADTAAWIERLYRLEAKR